MHIELNTDKNISSDERLLEYTEGAFQGPLARFQDRITRVTAHFADENSSEKNAADDKRCTLEARLAGLQPLAATHFAPTVREALAGAIQKLESAITSVVEREQDKQRRS